jgi:hypothetical protein
MTALLLCLDCEAEAYYSTCSPCVTEISHGVSRIHLHAIFSPHLLSRFEILAISFCSQNYSSKLLRCYSTNNNPQSEFTMRFSTLALFSLLASAYAEAASDENKLSSKLRRRQLLNKQQVSIKVNPSANCQAAIAYSYLTRALALHLLPQHRVAR